MNGRGWTWPVFAVFLTVVIAFHAYMGRFAHPMADDFSYALKDVSQGAWNAALWEYDHWNGRYASNFLVLFGPLRGGLDAIHLYRLIPAALFVVTFLGAFTFMIALGRPALPGSHAAIAALIWTALFAHVMPDMSEGFYWYTGSVTYQLPNALCLFALALLIRGIRNNALWVMIAIVPFLAFIIGCNEVIMLLVVVGTLLAGAWSFRQNLRWSAAGVVITVLIIGCALLMILAPGNAVRGAFFPERHQLLRSLGMSVLQTGRFTLEWAACPSLLLLSMVWWMHHRHLAQRFPLLSSGFGLSPWKSVPVLFAVIFLCVFPAYWSTGILGQHRTANVACFFFLPLWFMNLSVFAARFGGTVMRLHDTDRLRVTAALLLLVAVDLSFSGNSGEAITDLTTGRAERADVQLWNRYELLRQAAERPEGIATIPFIADPPRSLYVLDLRDRHFLVNQDYAAWFGLKEVRPHVLIQSDAAKTTN